MTDISKCKGKGCPHKESCWRYLAPSDRYWQSFCEFEKGINKTGKCSDYWFAGLEEKQPGEKDVPSSTNK